MDREGKSIYAVTSQSHMVAPLSLSSLSLSERNEERNLSEALTDIQEVSNLKKSSKLLHTNSLLNLKQLHQKKKYLS